MCLQQVFANQVGNTLLCDQDMISDFFIGVFERKQRTILELKSRFEEKLTAIPATMLQLVINSFNFRLKECVSMNGGNLADVTFKN